MKRTILTVAILFTAGMTCLLAQQPAAPAAGKVPMAKSQAELKAVQALNSAQAPDDVIKAAEDLLTKFADTEYKEYALTREAQAYKDKRDAVNAQVFGERVLQMNPKSFMTEMLVAEVITPNIKKNDLNHDDEVAKVIHLLNDAIANVQAASKINPQQSDADWESGKKFIVAQAHSDLGTLARVERKWDDAIKEYKLALEGDPDQDAYAAYLAASYLAAGNSADAIATCDKLLAKPNLNPAIKQYATNVKTQAGSAKK
jgi:tetratricopeptide (TPR) repeat protein